MYKERYFTTETIQSKSQELLASVAESRRRHAGICYHPARAALFVLDLQEYFFHEKLHAFIPSAPAILPGIEELIDAFLGANRPVIATSHLNTKNDAGMMSKWWHDLINSQSSHSSSMKIVEKSGINLLSKSQYDAFFRTSLEKTLREQRIEQVVICGVMTYLCCETTARSAFMRGFEVFFTVDGTATYNEELHRASLLTLSHGFAIPVLIKELVEQMAVYGV